MTGVITLEAAARLAHPSDNVAIATMRLEAGARIQHGCAVIILDATVLEGHRFAIERIEAEEELRSWGMPFGTATCAIAPGTYVCNAAVLHELRSRVLHATLPAQPNFNDTVKPFTLGDVTPAGQVPLHDERRTFLGYVRGEARGAGLRNYILLLATTSKTNSYVRELEARLGGVAHRYEHIDGIVAVAHTEGGREAKPNNLALVLRTLAGFMVHPNIGAVLAVDDGTGSVRNDVLRAFMREGGYPLDSVPHHFLTVRGSFSDGLRGGEAVVRGWLERVNGTRRTEQPVGSLKIALQCGGSDAFSGISGNPLAAWVAREVIRNGGAANLAETDELIGAEAYVLDRVDDVCTAERFLNIMERFKERVAWHGATAEGNPSGGNRLRGLYNIALKSIGAAMKRHPDVRLDGVLEYGEAMPGRGFYFMDSPGNDLESIAGQVASGCNLIFFITGNGSITNFPFVPAIKIVTTTGRYALLRQEMDINAGAYLDGIAMDELGSSAFELALDVAAGRRTAGENAGHAQVQLWRDWQQTDSSLLTHLQRTPAPPGTPLPVKAEPSDDKWQITMFEREHGYSTDNLALILPTSLCAGQIARLAANTLNTRNAERDGRSPSRYVALVHTEGCGVSGGSSESMYVRTMRGYATHPMVQHCLLLEHGCEKTHNDYMRQYFAGSGVPVDAMGWASIQQDGGIQTAMHKIETWFRLAIAGSTAPKRVIAGLGRLRVGIAGTAVIPVGVATSFAHIVRLIVGAGGTVTVAKNSALLAHPQFLMGALEDPRVHATLAYGQVPSIPGFHVMETSSDHWTETLTGLGATGVESVVTYVDHRTETSHPFIPVLQTTADEALAAACPGDLDLVFRGDPASWASASLQQLCAVASGRYTPKLLEQRKIDFQVSRGELGISL